MHLRLSLLLLLCSSNTRRLGSVDAEDGDAHLVALGRAGVDGARALLTAEVEECIDRATRAMDKELVEQHVLVLPRQVLCVIRIAVGWTVVGPGHLGALAAAVGCRPRLEESLLNKGPLVEGQLVRRLCLSRVAVILACE